MQLAMWTLFVPFDLCTHGSVVMLTAADRRFAGVSVLCCAWSWHENFTAVNEIHWPQQSIPCALSAN